MLFLSCNFTVDYVFKRTVNEIIKWCCSMFLLSEKVTDIWNINDKEADDKQP